MITRRELLKGVSISSFFGLIGSQSAEAATSNKSIVLVHGRSQGGRKPHTIKAEWTQALDRGLRLVGKQLPTGTELHLPFYGDVLDTFVREFSIPLNEDIQSKGASPDDAFLEFQLDYIAEIKERSSITDAQVDAEMTREPNQKGPLNWKWVQAVLRVIDTHSGMSAMALESFTRDVFLYCTRDKVRSAIDKIVHDEIAKGPSLVIGHSLGSVVAYNVLGAQTNDISTTRFITVGSPLAVRAVRNTIQPIRFPKAVSGWYNAYDKRDVVSLYPLDRANFTVQPSIANYAEVNNHTANRHGIGGYLDDPNVAAKVLENLEG